MVNWINSWNDFLTQNPVLAIKNPDKAWELPDLPAHLLAEDESFWKKVSADFPHWDKVINLNNGAVSSGPHIVEHAFTSYYSLVNKAPSFFLWKVMEKGRELIREGLADLIKSSAEEIAILRNATEALNNVIFGIELKEDDEVVACKQDYSKAVSSWKQRALRDKIKIVWVDLQGAEESNEEIVGKYISAFSDKTKVLHLTHVINWNGQTLPAEAIIKEAKKRNIEVLLDGAHSFGILETDVSKLECDYFVTALHKWLSGPIPSALLYVNKKKISKLWPLASSFTPASDDIRKFEELSIQLLPNILGLGFAIEYYLQLGRVNKEYRVRHLRRFWTSQLEGLDGIVFNTPFEEDRCCVIVNIAVEGWEPAVVEEELLKQDGIHVACVVWENMKGIRITPNIYTQVEDLQKFVNAMKRIVKGNRYDQCPGS